MDEEEEKEKPRIKWYKKGKLHESSFEDESDEYIISLEDYVKIYENILKDRYRDLEDGTIYNLRDLFTGTVAVRTNGQTKIIDCRNIVVEQVKLKNGNYIRIYQDDRMTHQIRVGSSLFIYNIDEFYKKVNELIYKDYTMRGMTVDATRKEININRPVSVSIVSAGGIPSGVYIRVLSHDYKVYFLDFNMPLLFKKRKRIFNEVDPFGEEDWGDD